MLVMEEDGKIRQVGGGRLFWWVGFYILISANSIDL